MMRGPRRAARFSSFLLVYVYVYIRLRCQMLNFVSFFQSALMGSKLNTDRTTLRVAAITSTMPHIVQLFDCVYYLLASELHH